MAGWLRIALRSFAAAAGAGAAQLGTAQALAILVWSTVPAPDVWRRQLTWLVLIFAAAVLTGVAGGRRSVRTVRQAIVNRRTEAAAAWHSGVVPHRGGVRASGQRAVASARHRAVDLLRRFAIGATRVYAAVFAALGAFMTFVLVWLPARNALPAEDIRTLAVAAVIGSAVGAVVALVALRAGPVAANVAIWIGAMWIFGLASAGLAIASGRPTTAPRLGVLDAPHLIGPGEWWLGPNVMIVVAAFFAVAVAATARGARANTIVIAVSGLAGPGLVATTYLIVGPGDGLRSAYTAALVAPFISVLASIGTALARRPAKKDPGPAAAIPGAAPPGAATPAPAGPAPAAATTPPAAVATPSTAAPHPAYATAAAPNVPPPAVAKPQPASQYPAAQYSANPYPTNQYPTAPSWPTQTSTAETSAPTRPRRPAATVKPPPVTTPPPAPTPPPSSARVTPPPPATVASPPPPAASATAASAAATAATTGGAATGAAAAGSRGKAKPKPKQRGRTEGTVPSPERTRSAKAPQGSPKGESGRAKRSKEPVRPEPLRPEPSADEDLPRTARPARVVAVQPSRPSPEAEPGLPKGRRARRRAAKLAAAQAEEQARIAKQIEHEEKAMGKREREHVDWVKHLTSIPVDPTLTNPKR